MMIGSDHEMKLQTDILVEECMTVLSAPQAPSVIFAVMENAVAFYADLMDMPELPILVPLERCLLHAYLSHSDKQR
ncbi:hypothetical protein ARMGADRAFT_165373 [Armillaria gallica]|uniref:Uncharacterized protein n=1 Tax=Armillaria gallica TaxID=47427 RepID=A0A2H3DBE9_ARMGA|nr:hypothetical protein ARMGADRAFT_165384 [Armillaria gallica]PBK92568.1 hypothetical protein ARMGADRAFT_165373 [Armillaria gallica]